MIGVPAFRPPAVAQLLPCAPARPMSAYQAFSHGQGPLLSGPFTRGERERLLGERWKALSKAEKAQYKVSGIERRNRSRSPYNAFCKIQRPLLPPYLQNANREALLGAMWSALSGTERAKYITPVPEPRPAPPGIQPMALQPQALGPRSPRPTWANLQGLACSSAAPIGVPILTIPWAVEVSSEHELAAEALVGMAEVQRALLAQQGPGVKAAPAAQQSVKRAPLVQRLGLDLSRTGDDDTGGSRLVESVAPPRVNMPAAQQGASVEQTHTAREEVRRLIELARSSQGGPAGYEGVYESGAGFGAELRRGTKRLRQTGFRSAFEAALERARWTQYAVQGSSK